MPARVLICIDPLPLEDGTCQTTAWIEQSMVADMLPTVDQAHIVGGVFFGSLVVIAAMSLLLPPREDD